MTLFHIENESQVLLQAVFILMTTPKKHRNQEFPTASCFLSK